MKMRKWRQIQPVEFTKCLHFCRNSGSVNVITALRLSECWLRHSALAMAFIGSMNLALQLSLTPMALPIDFKLTIFLSGLYGSM